MHLIPVRTLLILVSSYLTAHHTHTHFLSVFLFLLIFTASPLLNKISGEKKRSESDDMEGQNCVHDLQFLPMAINWIATNASGLLGDHDASQHYIMNPGSNWIHPESVPVPEWMHCPQTPQNYVDFLAEKGYNEMQKQMSYNISSQLPSSRLADPSQLEEYLRPHTEGNFITTSVQKQGWTEDCTSAFQAYSSSCATESKYASGGRRKRSREKAYAADRCRRLRISHWLEALQELVPHSKEVGRAALLDEVIDHVRYLQFKMKDLSRSRLGGESTSNSFIFLEGHGHYLVQEQMLNGPLEEIMGKLIDVYPSAATELLQSRGLIVMPVNVAEGLRDPMETLDIQGEGWWLASFDASMSSKNHRIIHDCRSLHNDKSSNHDSMRGPEHQARRLVMVI